VINVVWAARLVAAPGLGFVRRARLSYRLRLKATASLS
jgi:hypothetical protein